MTPQLLNPFQVAAAAPSYTHANIRGWWKFDELSATLSDGDQIASLASSASNNGGVATPQMQQGTSANRPIFKAAIRNGLGIGRFDGVNDYLETTPRQATAATLVLVRKLASSSLSATKVQIQNSGPANTSGLGMYHDATATGKHGAYLRGVVGIASSTSVTTNWERVILCCGNSGGSAGNTRMYVNGTQIISTTDDMATINSDLGAFFIGKDDTGTLMSGAMDVGEAMAFNAALDATEVATLDAYLAARWG